MNKPRSWLAAATWPPRIAAVLLLTLALTPYGWIGARWPAFGQFVDWMFDTATMHALGHSSIFLLLGLLLLQIVPALRRHPWRFLALLLLAGVAQEAFQLLYKQRPLDFDTPRDLLTDLVGAVVALSATRSASEVKRGSETL